LFLLSVVIPVAKGHFPPGFAMRKHPANVAMSTSSGLHLRPSWIALPTLPNVACYQLRNTRIFFASKKRFGSGQVFAASAFLNIPWVL